MKKIIFLVMLASGLLAEECEGFTTTLRSIKHAAEKKMPQVVAAFLDGTEKLPFNKGKCESILSGLSRATKFDKFVLFAWCDDYVDRIMSAFENENRTIVVSCRTLKKIKDRIFRFKHTQNFKIYLAAVATCQVLEEMYRESQQQDLRCSICDNQIPQNRKELPCSHIFCKECLRGWYFDLAVEREKGVISFIGCPECSKETSLEVRVELNENKKLHRKIVSIRKEKATRLAAERAGFYADSDSFDTGDTDDDSDEDVLVEGIIDLSLHDNHKSDNDAEQDSDSGIF